MKITAQNFTNIKLSLIIKSKTLASEEISGLLKMKPNSERTENGISYWEFEENKTLRTIPYSEDFEIDNFITYYLQQNAEVWEALKNKAEIKLLINANDDYDHRSVDEDVKFNSEIELTADVMSELVERNINLKICQSFLMKFYDYTF